MYIKAYLVFKQVPVKVEEFCSKMRKKWKEGSIGGLVRRLQQ